MSNVYYSPEEFGLEVVGEIEFSDGDYQFDTRVIWKHSSGKLYTARDSGCSCPSPFEEYNKLEDLDELTDLGELEREVRELGSGYSVTSSRDAATVVARVRRLLFRPPCGACGKPRSEDDYLCRDCRAALVA